MHDVHDVEQAERMGRARSRLFFVLAIVFFAGQSAYFASSPLTRDSHARIGAWLVLVVLMLMLLATGGCLLCWRRVRDVLAVVILRYARLAALATGSAVTTITVVAAYAGS